MAEQIVVQGIEEAIAKLSELPEKIADKILRAAVKEATDMVRDDAKMRAPVKTGTLREAITSNVRKRKNDVIGTISIGKEAFYGAFVELGTKRIRAKPFLRPAADANREKAAGIVRDHINDKLESLL